MPHAPLNSMTTITLNLQAVRTRIERAAVACGRDAREIALLAVSKNASVQAIEEARGAGQRAFGESYAQEGVNKITQLASQDIEWHFIGPIQSNKTKLIAQHFHWAQSVDRWRLAERLAEQRPSELGPLQVCIQVNVSGEASKSGIAPSAAVELAQQVAALPRLRLRGLMTVPAPTADVHTLRRQFRMLRTLCEELAAEGLALDTLSMGMSDDLEVAIAEGATMVRVGRAIFGDRAT
jgi:PLP dependent protein